VVPEVEVESAETQTEEIKISNMIQFVQKEMTKQQLYDKLTDILLTKTTPRNR